MLGNFHTIENCRSTREIFIAAGYVVFEHASCHCPASLSSASRRHFMVIDTNSVTIFTLFEHKRDVPLPQAPTFIDTREKSL